MSSPGRPLDTTPPDPWDTAGKWLAARYQFTNRERDRVKGAMRSGEPLRDPRLRGAACGLASDILAGRLRMPGIVASYVTGVVWAGAGGAGCGYALYSSRGYGDLVMSAIVCAAVVHNVVFAFVFSPRRMPGNPRRSADRDRG